MRTRVQRSSLVALQTVYLRRTVIPDIARNGVRRNTTQAICHALRVAQRSKESLYTRCGKRGEEILQVQTQKRLLAGVRCCKCRDGATFDKSMDRGMGRNAIENTGENSPLQRL